MSAPYRVLAAGLALVLSAAAAEAAAPGAAVRVPFAYRSWTIESPDGSETTLSQFHVPVVSTVSFAPGLDLVLSTSYGSSSLESGDEESLDLNGAADVTAQLLYRLPGNRLMLEGGINLPAGKKELTAEELDVARSLAHPVLGFTLKQYGRGLDLSGGVAAATLLGPSVSAGAGAGVIIPGGYALLEGEEDYTPGTEIAVSAGIDVGSTESPQDPMLRLDGSYRMYGTDQLGDADIFEEGDQIELQALGRTGLGPLLLSSWNRLVLKADNVVFEDAGDSIEETQEASGTTFAGQLGLDLPVGETAAVGLQGEWRVYDGSEGGRRDGTALGFGPSAMLGLGTQGWIRATALYLTGTLTGVDDLPDDDLSGFAVTVGIFWRGNTETR